MIYSNDITIPVLCPINFSENKETYFYPEQDMFVPSIPLELRISFLITEAMFESSDDITIEFEHYKGYVVLTSTMSKTAFGTSYWYASKDRTMDDLPDSFVGYIKIYHGTDLLAKSTLYQRAKKGNYEKVISYTNTKNDWNTVFLESNFEINVPCGFNPNNYSAKRKVENYQDQDIQNINIYAQPYDTVILSIGSPNGVPNWMYKKLNAIFACNTKKVDGIEYKVAEGAELEKKDSTYEGLHILEIELQPLNNYAQ